MTRSAQGPQALSHAVDRSRLVELTNGLAIEAYGMVPTGVFGYIDDPEIAAIQAFDPALAKELLVGTAFEGGQNWPEITMHMRGQRGELQRRPHGERHRGPAPGKPGHERQDPGLARGDPGDRSSSRTSCQLVLIRWWYDYPDPNNGYGDMFYSRKASGKRQAWSNAEFDDLVNQGKAEPDPDKRLEIYKQAERIIQEDVGYMPLVYRAGPVRLQAVGQGRRGEPAGLHGAGRQHLRPHAVGRADRRSARVVRSERDRAFGRPAK